MVHSTNQYSIISVLHVFSLQPYCSFDSTASGTTTGNNHCDYITSSLNACNSTPITRKQESHILYCIQCILYMPIASLALVTVVSNSAQIDKQYSSITFV